MITRNTWAVYPAVALLSLSPAVGFSATSEESPPDKLQAFLAIADRNPFGLKDPPVVKPPEVELPVVEEEPPPDVKLVGVFSINGTSHAQFLVKDQTGGTAAAAKGLTLKVGEAQEGIRLISLAQADGMARVQVRGKEARLELKPPERPAVAAANRVNPAPGNTRRGQVRQGPTPTPTANIRETRGRQQPTGGGVTVGGRNNSSADDANAQQSQSGLRSIPTRDVRTGRQNNLSADESAVLIELNREINRDRINAGAMPPLPPTPYTSDEDRQRIVVPEIPGE